MAGRLAKRKRRRRWDFGRLAAQVLCTLFAVVGALPLLGGLLVRSQPVLHWAGSETARVLYEQLGVRATYRVQMQLWPLQVAMLDVRVPASDGADDAFTAARIAVTPRVFSLLAGRLDVGDIEIDAPRGRLVIRDGEIANLAYRLPERQGSGAELRRAPFTSLAVTDAVMNLDVDGTRVAAGPFDLDVFTAWGPSFEVALRVAGTQVSRSREEEGGVVAVDEDVLCALDLRARFEPHELLVRRLSLLAMPDTDPAPGTQPQCVAGAAEDEAGGGVAVRLSQLRVERHPDQPLAVSGHVVARTPAALANRFTGGTNFEGWVGVVADIRYDGTTHLPQAHGRLRAGGIHLVVPGRHFYRLAERFETPFEITNDEIHLARAAVRYADGDVTIVDARVAPFATGVPLSAKRVEARGVQFPGLMRDLDVSDHAIVAWDIHRVDFTGVHGTIVPLRLDMEIGGETRNFEIFDRGVRDPARRHAIGVSAATLRGRVGVRPNAFEFYDTTIAFGNSSLLARIVSIGFDNEMVIDVEKSPVDLDDISPLVDIPWSGQSQVSAKLVGQSGDPTLTGAIEVENLVFGGFPIGDVQTQNIRFRPLKIDFRDVTGKKGRTRFAIPTARLDFDTAAAVLADATVESQQLDVKDFFTMFHFDEDPRFADIHGVGGLNAQVHYALGGPEDRCGGGYLAVAGDLSLQQADVFGEQFDAGDAHFDFRWPNQESSYLGLEVEIPSISLKKGSGSVLGSVSVRRGAVLSGHVVATGLPLDQIQGLGMVGELLDARASAVVDLSGTVDEMRLSAHVNLTPTRIGGSTLPPSQLSVTLEPTATPLRSVGTGRCGQPIPAEFDQARYDRDEALGVFHISGSLFGDQVQVEDLQVTRQRSQHVSGVVRIADLDLEAIGEMLPERMLASGKLEGRLSGKLTIEDLPMEDRYGANLSVALAELSLRRNGLRLELEPGARTIVMQHRTLEIPGLALGAAVAGGPRGVFDAQATIAKLGSGAEVDATLRLRPMELSALAGLVPRVERASGQVRGEVRLTGPVRNPSYGGGFSVEHGQLVVRGLSAPLTDLEVDLGIEHNELRLRKGTARIGSGSLQISGSAPIAGLRLGTARGTVTARSLTFTLADGVRTTLDTDLTATWAPNPASSGEERSLPRLTGGVTVRSFDYTRPIVMTADISTLAQRGKRTEFESYDPADDSVEFDVTLRANRPLNINNNLVTAQVEIGQAGLQLAGTNQRFGMRGDVRVRPGGRLQMRRNEFEIQHGQVRFDDLTRVAPQVDVTATTEYRRYSESLGDANAPTDAGAAGGTATAAAGGQWHIVMHAHGDADKLQVDLTSQPALAQDDIFLLLTVGLTRAELDQARSASVGESVALEALGTLSGADRAVSDALPVIDDFRFGSAYSSRTGRTEPTVTIGKRLADRIRANVTSGLSDSREVRSNLEWRLSRRVSVEGSYDNVNDISSSSLGNLGADVRWRLEFR